MFIEYTARIRMVEMGSAQSRGGYSDETVKLSTQACPVSDHVQSTLPPSFPHCRELRTPHQTGSRGLTCPLVPQMRRRKVVRKTRSPRVKPLPQCSRFTSCYGMNPQRKKRTHRKTTQILSLIMFKRIPGGRRLHNLITDNRQALSVHTLNVFVSRPDASGIDPLETVARMSHADSLRNSPNARSPWSPSHWEEERMAGNKDTLISIPNHTQSAVSTFRRTRDERRVTARTPVNPIRFSCESKRILLGSCWSSCSPFVSPFDIAETYGFGGNARWRFQKQPEENQLAQ
jgi:hypothetical protein